MTQPVSSPRVSQFKQEAGPWLLALGAGSGAGGRVADTVSTLAAPKLVVVVGCYPGCEADAEGDVASSIPTCRSEHLELPGRPYHEGGCHCCPPADLSSLSCPTAWPVSRFSSSWSPSVCGKQQSQALLLAQPPGKALSAQPSLGLVYGAVVVMALGGCGLFAGLYSGSHQECRGERRWHGSLHSAWSWKFPCLLAVAAETRPLSTWLQAGDLLIHRPS